MQPAPVAVGAAMEGSAETFTEVAVIGGGLSAIHTADFLKKKWKVDKVTLCMGNPFLEFPMAACPVLADPTRHPKWVSPNPSSFAVKGVQHVFGRVTEIDPDAKVIKFALRPDLAYKVCVVATGSRMPLIIPNPGDSLEQRMGEVKKIGKAIANAGTVVINGAGLIGLEMAGDVRAVHPDKRVVLLSRDGRILGSTHPASMQERVRAALDKMRIEVVAGTVPETVLGGGSEPALEPGTIVLKSGQEISYDVFLPCFAQGPNTDFLEGSRALDARRCIDANRCLQSKHYPELFGVGVTNQPLVGHPVSQRLTAQAQTCARNAKLALDGKACEEHRDTMSPIMERPPTVKIGHGKGAYMIWDTEVLPCLPKFCCCLWFGGGFPCCPPPCCWCCGPGCSTAFGSCCGPDESEGAAMCMLGFLLPKFPGGHGYAGIGEAPEQQRM